MHFLVLQIKKFICFLITLPPLRHIGFRPCFLALENILASLFSSNHPSLLSCEILTLIVVKGAVWFY